MADIKINLQVSSGGTTVTETKLAERLTAELNRAAQAAQLIRINTPGGGAGGAGGGAGGGGGGGNTNTPNQQNLNNQGAGYRQFRSIAGSGAEARDFAKQAEGLGGLVRLYATFAANIFAVGAAFRSLSKAIDTDNMITGLNQLGAASGKNLGSLAKQLIDVSDGAISLKDALAATAQAASGGLSGDQLLRLTEVARKASQALGRDMPDALGRLTRGVIKIEPELLDELGIMVKVDKAAADYARSLGKTASALTDVEKRQAFATATILQGEQKFKDIEMSANPYSKILASTQDLAQKTLTLINVAIAPVINLLSSSPTALSLAIAGMAAMLLKQAIPALGQWRASLTQSALTARQASMDINESFKKFQADNINRSSNIIAQRVAIQRAAMDASINNLKQAAAQGITGINSKLAQIVAQPVQDITQKNIKAIQTAEKSFRTKAATFTERAAPTGGGPVHPDAARAYLKQAEALTKQADALKQLRAQIPLAQADAAAFAQAQIRAQEELTRSQGRFSEAAQRQRIADRAERNAAKAEVLSNVAQNTQVMGMRGAFAALRSDIKLGQEAVVGIGRVGEAGYVAAVAARKPLEGLAATATLVRGSFAIATSAVSTFLAAFGPWAMIIGIAVMLGGALINMLKSNTKELEASAKATTVLIDAVKLLGNTLDVINKKPFLERVSVESVMAQASAFAEVTSAIEKSVVALGKADKAASGFDKFIDGIKGLWNGDLRSQATKGISAAIVQSLKGASDESRADLEASFSDILKTTDYTAQGITYALNNIPLESFLDTQSKIVVAVEATNKKMKDQAAVFSSIKTSLDEVGKAAQTITIGLTAQDTFAKFASSVVTAGNSMAQALSKPGDALLTLTTLLADVGRLSVLSPAMSADLISLSPEIQKQAESLQNAKVAVKMYSESLATLTKERDKMAGSMGLTPYEGDMNRLIKKEAEVSGTKAGREQAQKIQSEIEIRVNKSSLDLLKATVEDAFKNGAALMEIAMKNAEEAASLTVAKAASAGLSGPGTADTTFDIRSREISLQEQQIKAEMGLLTSQMENRSALEKLSNIVAIDTQVRIKQAAEAQLRATTTPASEKTSLQLSIDAANKAIDATKKSLELGDRITKNLSGLKGMLPRAANKQLTQMISEAPDLETKTSLQATQGQIMGGVSKQIALEAEQEAAAITRSLELIREKVAVQQKDKSILIDQVDLQLKSVTTAQDLMTVYSSEIQADKERLQAKKYSLEISKEQALYEGTIAELSARRVGGINVEKQIAQVQKEHAATLGAMGKKQAQELAVLSLDRATREEKDRLRIQEISNKDFETQQNSAKALVEYNQTVLGLKTSMGYISEADAAVETANIARQQLALESEVASRKEIQEYEAKIAESRLKAQGAIAQATIAGTDTTGISDRQASEENEIVLAHAKQVSSLTEINSLKLNGLSLTEKTALAVAKENSALDKQATLSKNISSLSESMAKAFGKAGTAIGNVAKILQRSVTDQIAIEKKKTIDFKKLQEAGPVSVEDQAKLDKKYALESASTQIGAAADVAGAVADSFDEQSSAAAAFHKIEKVMHIAKLAMDIQAMISSAAVAATEMGLASMTASAWIPAIWARAFGEGGPYLGWALGAAAVAMVLGGGGGGAKQPSSEEQQKVQGTGQSYNSKMELIDNGGGALGDSKSLSEAIKNGIEILATNNFELLNFSKDKMYDALVAIRDNTAQFAKALISTTGITGGNSAFGTTEGSSKTALGFSSKSTTVNDTGIKIIGRLSDLIAGKGTKQQYENVTKKSSSFWGISSSSSNAVNVKDLQNSASAYIKGIFSGFNDVLLSQAELLGSTERDVTKAMANLSISISTSAKGLTSEEFANAIMAEIGIQLDIAAKQTFPALKGLSDAYQNLGETTTEFIVRLANDSKNVKLAFLSIGKSFNYTGISAIEVSESLLKAAGGLDSFLTLTEDFKTNFLSAEEQLVPIQKAVTDEMSRMGFASTVTKEGFKSLVLAQDLTTETGRETYASLLKVSGAFSQVYEASETVKLSIKELAEAQLDQLARVLELQGRKTELLNLQRTRELKTLDKMLHPMQLYIYALEDEATAKDALKTAYDEETSARQTSIDSLKTSRDTLKDFATSLALGGQSILTPQQKYEKAKSDLSAITAVLDNANTSTKDRDIALGKLPTAISSLLETSKIFNASSDAYKQDYAYSQRILETNSQNLTQQLSAEEKSLEQLKTTVDKLIGINDGVKSVETAIKELTAAITNSDKYKQPLDTSQIINPIPAHAKGGMASGVSLVGEEGPEVVNFDTKGMVSTATDTKNLFEGFGAEVASELRALRAEVTLLKESAKLDAIMLARVTANANADTADKLTEALKDTANTIDYNSKSKPTTSF